MILILSEGKKFKILKKGTCSPPGRSWGLVQKPVSLLFHGALRGGSEFLLQAPSPLLSSNGEVPGDDVQMNWPNAKEPVGFMLLILISTRSRASLEITSPWSNLCPNTSWSLTFRLFFCMTRNLVPPWHGSSARTERGNTYKVVVVLLMLTVPSSHQILILFLPLFSPTHFQRLGSLRCDSADWTTRRSLYWGCWANFISAASARAHSVFIQWLGFLRHEPVGTKWEKTHMSCSVCNGPWLEGIETWQCTGCYRDFRTQARSTCQAWREILGLAPLFYFRTTVRKMIPWLKQQATWSSVLSFQPRSLPCIHALWREGGKKHKSLIEVTIAYFNVGNVQMTIMLLIDSYFNELSSM